MRRRITFLTTLTLGLGLPLAYGQPRPPLPIPAAQAVSGYAQFPFGQSLAEVRRRLEASFPGRTYAFAQGFGRTALRLRDGLTFHGEDVDATFVFIQGQLVAVKLEEQATATRLRAVQTFLTSRFGAGAPAARSALHSLLDPGTAQTHAQGSVALAAAEPGPDGQRWLTVTFQEPQVAARLRTQMDTAANLERLAALYERGGWKALPHEPLARTNEFLMALTTASGFEQAALLGAEVTTQERAWAGAYFYMLITGQVAGEERQRQVLTLTGEELNNPLSLFLLGRIRYTEAQYADDRSATAQAEAEQGYLQMINAYTLTSLLMEDVPQLSSLLANSHVAMLAGLATGAAELSAADRAKVDRAWQQFYRAFRQQYPSVPLTGP
ncbi:hypothetical protein [Deinococcus multiflagellatus]|uniref:Uncharacterized protein n=1 Tax=Deinococcus multiflagellatus TaxID=1656887 RepID=A0ABW1ZMJ4_9DEIO|nr:hypothetical protein [Deinococcus multiflagellatus]MBZ9714029.1 hypothetical protein [Deinococcus multiflagellatus]